MVSETKVYDYEMDEVEQAHEENVEEGFADAIIDSAEGAQTDLLLVLSTPSA